MSHWIIAPIVLPALLAALMLLGLRGHLAGQRIVSLGGVLALNAIAVALLVEPLLQDQGGSRGIDIVRARTHRRGVSLIDARHRPPRVS